MTDLEHSILQQLIGIEGIAKRVTHWYYHGKDAKLLWVLDNLSIMLERVRPDVETLIREKPSRSVNTENIDLTLSLGGGMKEEEREIQ